MRFIAIALSAILTLPLATPGITVAEPIGERLYSALYPQTKEVDIGPIVCTKLAQEIKRAVDDANADGYRVESRQVERLTTLQGGEMCQATLVLRRMD